MTDEAPTKANEKVELNSTNKYLKSIKYNADNNPNEGFPSYSAELKVGKDIILVRLVKMNCANMLFLSQDESNCPDELGVAIPKNISSTKFLSPSATLIGKKQGSNSQRWAEQLSKRYGRQYFVSSNINLDGSKGPLMERSISAWLQQLHQNNLFQVNEENKTA